MLRKALSLRRFPYKSGCACSEKWGRPSTFALLFTRLGGHAPKSWTAAGLARAFFIRFYRFLGGYTPKKHWIFSRETGWSCSEFCIQRTDSLRECLRKGDALFLLVRFRNNSAISYEQLKPLFAVDSKHRTDRGPPGIMVREGRIFHADLTTAI